MLDKTSEEAFASLGVDISQLSEALNSKEEVSVGINLPKAEGFTQEDLDTISVNRFAEGKQAHSEIKAKELKKSLGIDIEGKNLDKVIQAYGEKMKAEASNSLAEDDLKLLRTKVKELEDSNESIHSEYAKKAFDNTLRTDLLSQMPEVGDLSKDDIIDLYLMKNNVVDSNGVAHVEVDGEIVKDELRNPISATEHFKSYIDSKGLVSVKGISADDSKGSGSGAGTPKFANADEFSAYCKQTGANPMSREMIDLYIANRK